MTWNTWVRSPPHMLSSRVFWKLLAASAGLNLAAAMSWADRVAVAADELVVQVERTAADAALLVGDDLAAKEMVAGRSEHRRRGRSSTGQRTGVRLTSSTPTARCSPIL